MKKILTSLTIIPIMCLLAGCGNDSTLDNDSGSHDVPTYKNTTLTLPLVNKTFAMNDTDDNGFSRLDKQVQNYVKSIKNLKDYNIKVKTSSTGTQSNMALYETVVLTKK